MSNLLEAWLAKATRGLSDESVAEVRTEIGAHYEDAYEEATAHGSRPDEAERTAVAALGSPRSANREYRRVLLTGREAMVLRRLRHSSESDEAEPQICGFLVCAYWEYQLLSIRRKIPVEQWPKRLM
jgi:hypothetical protein